MKKTIFKRPICQLCGGRGYVEVADHTTPAHHNCESEGCPLQKKVSCECDDGHEAVPVPVERIPV